MTPIFKIIKNAILGPKSTFEFDLKWTKIQGVTTSLGPEHIRRARTMVDTSLDRSRPGINTHV